MRKGERLGTPLSRFLSRVTRAEASACWPWLGQKFDTGYGAITWEGRLQGAHRVMAHFAYGPIPPGKVVMHVCNNPICCNPAHLVVGTSAENSAMAARDGLYRGRTVLGADQIRAIRASTGTCATVGREFGVSACTVSRIRRRLIWTQVP